MRLRFQARRWLAGLALATAGALLPAVATAGPLTTGDVSPEAKWVMHVDYDAARQTEIAEAIRDREQLDRQLSQAFDWLEERYGIAREDLHGLTMYGETYAEHAGVAVLRADYEPKKVERVLQDQPKYETTQHEGVTLHTWSARDDFSEEPELQDTDTEVEVEDAASESEKANEPDRADQRKDDLQVDVGVGEDDYRHRVTAALLEDRILVGTSREFVVQAIDRLGREQPADDQVLGASIPEGTVFFGTAVELADLRERAELAMLADLKQITVIAGETDGNVFWTCRATATDETLARRLRDVVEGLSAFAHLAAQEARAQGEENVPDEEMLKLLALDVTQDGSKLRVHWQADAQEVVEAVEQIEFPMAPYSTDAEPATPPQVDEPEVEVEEDVEN